MLWTSFVLYHYARHLDPRRNRRSFLPYVERTSLSLSALRKLIQGRWDVQFGLNHQMSVSTESNLRVTVKKYR